MKFFVKLTSLAVFGLGYSLAFAQANPGATLVEPTFNCIAGDGSESTYEIWRYGDHADKHWDAARSFAETRGPIGQANLAVFLDRIEEECVLGAADAAGLGFNQQLWIGLQQADGNNEPAGGWSWVTGESLDSADYVNWASGEPNNSGGNEEHGTIGRFGYVNDNNSHDGVGWNDEIAARTVGFLVEISNTSDAQDCLETDDGVPDGEFGEGGCNPSAAQIVELPQALEGRLDGKTITQFLVPARPDAQTEVCGNNGEFEFVGADPRVNEMTGAVEDPVSLDLNDVFDLSVAFPDLDENDLDGKVLLRADTVGSPCLALVFGEANFEFADFASLFFADGPVAAVTQDAEDVPGMFIFGKVGPLSDDQPDLQFVPQAAYQTDDRFLLAEEAASPFTNDVFNPSRQKTFQFSFYPLNTREACLFIDLNLDPESAEYLEEVFECKYDLAKEYFKSLKQILFEAKPNLNGPFGQLVSKLNKVRGPLNTRRWAAATDKLETLRDAVIFADWTIDPRNDPGHLIMRIDNLIWRIEQLEKAEMALVESAGASQGHGRGR